MKYLGNALIIVAALIAGCSTQSSSTALEWPTITKECKPWTYWWWMGSAVDKANLTANLEDYSSAGMGGVHIIPIYGAKGYKDHYIPFLSHEWMEMLSHTVTEAKRLGMGVDMTSGTGWPFGGPQITPEDAASMVRILTFNVTGGGRFIQSFDKDSLEALEESFYDFSNFSDDFAFDIQAIGAFSEDGEFIDLASQLHENRINWTAPEGVWKVYAVIQVGTGQQVKRAAPGGEGNVMDFFSEQSLKTYFARFDKAFGSGQSTPVRAFYNDSYEVFRSNWTDDLFEEFSSRRGYDLLEYLPALLGNGDNDTVARVRHDYNETVSDMLLERFTIPWVAWCHSKGSKTRNQAHGSPGNLLDLYAAADIPETEAFGPSGFNIPGLRVDSNMPEHFGKPDLLAQKFASSAAHITGKQLVSSESCTWLGEHFQVSLSQVKPQIDELFISGINHVFFHGMPYSPKEAKWPGWLFYASTHFAQTGSLWKDLPELNAYIARCQSFLQEGRPANDVLLYWPVHDLWRCEADADMLHHLGMHNVDEWLYGTPFCETAVTLWNRGYTFDYISDRLLSGVTVSNGKLKTPGGTYQTLVVPGCSFMPSATLEKITGFAKLGATIIFVGNLPGDVPGSGNLESERAQFKELIKSIPAIENGHIITGENCEQMLMKAGISREQVVDYGVNFIRRTHDSGYHYFFTNLGDKTLNNWVTLGIEAQSAVIFDTVFNRCGIAAVRRDEDGKTQVYIQLEPGQSCILRTFASERVKGQLWKYLSPSGQPYEITGNWGVTFVEGGPRLPAGFTTSGLASWTELGDEDTKVFSGTAKYTLSFEKPSVEADGWTLDLGRVHESARVWLNGKYVCALWCFPFNARLDEKLREGENLLEIEITSLAANRIADLDRRNVPWKNFHDINYVNIRYETFDASNWPLMDSGLSGPVMLVPQKIIGDIRE